MLCTMYLYFSVQVSTVNHEWNDDFCACGRPMGHLFFSSFSYVIFLILCKLFLLYFTLYGIHVHIHIFVHTMEACNKDYCYYYYYYYYIYICFRPANPALDMKFDQVIVSLVGFHMCMYYSCSCFKQFSPFNHTIIHHLYISTPISIVSPYSLGLMLFVCSWCVKKIKFILSYLITMCAYIVGNSGSTREDMFWFRVGQRIPRQSRWKLFG